MTTVLALTHTCDEHGNWRQERRPLTKTDKGWTDRTDAARRVLATSHRSELTFARLCRIGGDRSRLFQQLELAAVWRRRLASALKEV